MPVSVGLAYTGRPRTHLDPRSKLAFFIAVNTIGLGAAFSGSGAAARVAVTVLLAVLLAAEGAWLWSASAVVVTTVGLMVYAWLPPVGWAMPLVGLVNLMARFWPVVLMGCYVISTTTVSQFIAALRRLHLPASFTIPFAVVMRFLPTLAQESSGISEALRSRGLRLGAVKPHTWLEYRLVPLTMRAVAIGDELTTAALARGLDRTVERTSLARIGFGPADWLVLTAALTVIAIWALAPWTPIDPAAGK
ncbi:MAG: energy-coupling factor transporter transmembrane protein EcfT [Bifidobacteriaceae bacterium]|nr:energy-coupling factor transporter transmembrane protein EcfT [Bifidobacteriaceae bacterium]